MAERKVISVRDDDGSKSEGRLGEETEDDGRENSKWAREAVLHSDSGQR